MLHTLNIPGETEYWNTWLLQVKNPFWLNWNEIKLTINTWFCDDTFLKPVFWGQGASVNRLPSFDANFLSLRVTQTYTAILTFESVDEILWCDYSYETSLSQLSRGNVSFLVFHKLLYCCLMWFVVDSLTFFLGRCIAVLEVSFFRSRNEENGYDHLGKK